MTYAESSRIAGESLVCPSCGAELIYDDGTERQFACGRWDKAPAGSLTKSRSVITIYRRCNQN